MTKAPAGRRTPNRLNAANQINAKSLNAPKVAFPLLIGAFLCAVLYFVAGYFTSAYFMGDTVDYANAILERAAGRDYFFWEFGHLLWRPLGFVLFKISSPMTGRFVGGSAQASATLVLIGLSWLSGLVSVLSLYGVLNRICRSGLPVMFTVLGFIGAQSFLNYFHTGAPYIPGLALLLLGLYLLVANGRKDKPSLLSGIIAGISFAGSGLFWFPFVLAIPAALIAPLLLLGFNKQRLKLSLLAMIVGAVVGVGVYFAVMAHIGIHNVPEFRAWMEKTSRTTGSSNRGVSRAVFGFARSFINMGNDGMLFKRYLLHDPLNPVSVLDLARFSLWKLLAFYLFVAALLLGLLTSMNGRRMLVLFLVNVLPVIGFAIYWQGGDPERYLPLFPMFFIALGWVLDSGETRRLFKYPLVLFVLAMLVTNGFMLARKRLSQQQEVSAARVRELAGNLKPNSWVFAANWQDDLINFNRSFPLNPVNRNSNLKLGALISPGEPEVARWRQEFATRTQSVWANGGDVWISRRLFVERPRPEWNWVEGDDQRVSWTDLYRYASQLELGQAIGGDDGFVMIVNGERNRKVLSGE
ncbi:MAG TPA: hypothetical protein VN643_21005 [Pyrinomonadaceae bacterium]|nr:hypothetical protein [Pyrinomonadaceae bacterium]